MIVHLGYGSDNIDSAQNSLGLAETVDFVGYIDTYNSVAAASDKLLVVVSQPASDTPLPTVR